jgi:hypothetical protein
VGAIVGASAGAAAGEAGAAAGEAAVGGAVGGVLGIGAGVGHALHVTAQSCENVGMAQEIPLEAQLLICRTRSSGIAAVLAAACSCDWLASRQAARRDLCQKRFTCARKVNAPHSAWQVIGASVQVGGHWWVRQLKVPLHKARTSRRRGTEDPVRNAHGRSGYVPRTWRTMLLLRERMALASAWYVLYACVWVGVCVCAHARAFSPI